MSEETTVSPDEPGKRLPGEGKRGPRRKKLSPSQRKDFLDLLSQGYGRDLVCIKMSLPLSRYRNTRDASPSFRRECRSKIEAARQKIEKVAHDLADVADHDLLPKQLDRIDKARQLAQVRYDNRAAKGGSSNETLILAVAYKIATFFSNHVPPDKLALLMGSVPSLVEEVLNAGRNAKPEG